MNNDLISRKAAIRAYCEHECGKGMIRGKCGCDDCGTIFDDIPSAQPERKKGKWEEKEVIHEVEASTAIDEWQSARCSVCGKYHTTPYMYYFDEFNFCPNCGAKMEG